MKKLVFLCCWMLSIIAAFPALQTPIDFHFAFNGSNAVQVAWNAYPGKSYVLQTATNLAGTWSNSSTLIATSNSLAFSFPTTAAAQFFKVVKLDTEGPEIVQTAPLDGSIAVSPQSTVTIGLSDVTGINTNSITLAIGSNAPVSLSSSQLVYSNGVLTYTPASPGYLGTNGQIVVAMISAADTLGNVTTNFTWSFQLALPTVPVANILFIPGTNGLVLVSTNGDYYTFTYPGAASGLTAGLHLVNSDPYTGYTRTVVSFTEYPASNTVVVLTRQTKLAELLQSGSLSGSGFTELTAPQPAGAMRAFGLPAKVLIPGLDFNHRYELQHVLYQDANLKIEILTNSHLYLEGSLELSGNFQSNRLTQFECKTAGEVDFRLEAHVGTQGAVDSSGSVILIPKTDPPKRFKAWIGPIPIGPVPVWIPVWVDVTFELNGGWTTHLEGSAHYTNGVQATKEFLQVRRWDLTNGWSATGQNPPLELSYFGPRWSVESTGNLHVYLQPKITALIYSTAGAWYDLQPYADLVGRYQSNPHEYELALYGGLTGSMGLDLSIWDSSWSDLPSMSYEFIPRTLLWQTNNLSRPPQITGQPADQWVNAGQTATFTVTANGPGPLTYCWQRYGLNLTEDSRTTGTRSSTLHIDHCSTNDIGTYRVLVSNPNGTVTSQNALLTVYSTNATAGMALIPAGNFTMGDISEEAAAAGGHEAPLHTVYVSAFYMDKYEVTKASWDSVYSWAIAHGYSFDCVGSGKASMHPVQKISWFDCVKWCNARSEMEGKMPAYYTSAGQTTVYRTEPAIIMDNDSVNWNSGYRLPTEAEWEKAARGGLSEQRFPWGNTISWSQANYYAYPLSAGGYSYDVSPTNGWHPTFAIGFDPYTTSPVGYFAPNGYGLYDMAGNVREWCWDWYGAYSSASQIDPRGPTSPTWAFVRVVRGGGAGHDALYCRTSCRQLNSPIENSDYTCGFRSVLPAGQ